ncbi:VOC family protein [Phaeobacter sp. J2-8]|uniref:VOC family protein n=1 Tax=Phaeobacter sp. J2-8 TaxID=2931394 RepID=UPI001FD34733|nr:VOC family protein [Phaeobacter sp. J2-8]MCJ7871735.1 VOC family protein [Phaeobacter sp. J2-8]
MPKVHGEIHWNELMTRDIAGAKAYYSSTCGWTWETVPMGEAEYHVAKRGEDMVAGMMDMADIPNMDEIPAHWFMYIAVDDVDAAAKQTAAMGGTVMRDLFEVEGVGRFAIIKDPTGAALGLMTPSNP